MFEWELGLTQYQVKEQVAGGRYIGGSCVPLFLFPVAVWFMTVKCGMDGRFCAEYALARTTEMTIKGRNIHILEQEVNTVHETSEKAPEV